MRNTKGVIFDNDGCLQCHSQIKGYGDPEDQYYAAFEAIALTFGQHLEKDSDLRRQVMGIDIRDVGRHMIEGLELPLNYDQWKITLDQILLALAPFAEVGDGGAQLLQELYDRGLKIGVASSAVSTVLAAKWQRFPKQRSLLSCFVAGDDPRVKRSKPEPDLLLVAAQDLDLPARECAYVGDSASDILAAKAAGMLSIAVPSGGRPRSYYKAAGADFIIASLPEVQHIIT